MGGKQCEERLRLWVWIQRLGIIDSTLLNHGLAVGAECLHFHEPQLSASMGAVIHLPGVAVEIPWDHVCPLWTLAVSMRDSIYQRLGA